MVRLFNAIATLFGVGYLSKASGTVASVVTLIPLVLLQYYGMKINAAGLAIIVFIAYLSVRSYLNIHNPQPQPKDQANPGIGSPVNLNDHQARDPKEVVVDELVGQIIAFSPIALLSQSPIDISINAILSLILFRFFDIVKPFPINYIDNNTRGPAFVILDDILAGLMALGCKTVLVILWT